MAQIVTKETFYTFIKKGLKEKNSFLSSEILIQNIPTMKFEKYTVSNTQKSKQINQKMNC